MMHKNMGGTSGDMEKDMERMPMRADKMSRMMDEMKYMRDEDMELMDMKIPVDAEDGEEVGMVMMGKAQGGMMMRPMGAMMNLGEMKRPNRLKQMMSSKEDEEE